jgi:hypothetical protein
MLKETYLDGKEPEITDDTLDEVIPEDYNERLDNVLEVVKKNVSNPFFNKIYYLCR